MSEVLDEFKKIQMRTAAVDTFYALKSEWICVFEKLKDGDMPYVEALIFADISAGGMPEPVKAAVQYWCAEVYEKLDDYDDL